MKRSAITGAIIAVTVGLATGVAGYTFVYAKGASYLTNNAAACANCHVMSEHYAGWIKSSHRSVATCNDCHTPANIFAKYLTKADNGFWHSFAFTTGNYPDPLRIKARNRRITENSCRKCHQDIVEAIDTFHREDSRTSCVRCHREVGHPK